MRGLWLGIWSGLEGGLKMQDKHKELRMPLSKPTTAPGMEALVCRPVARMVACTHIKKQQAHRARMFQRLKPDPA